MKGEIYLGERERELISLAILTQIGEIASVRDRSAALGVTGFDFNFWISNYQAILQKLGEE